MAHDKVTKVDIGKPTGPCTEIAWGAIPLLSLAAAESDKSGSGSRTDLLTVHRLRGEAGATDPKSLAQTRNVLRFPVGLNSGRRGSQLPCSVGKLIFLWLSRWFKFRRTGNSIFLRRFFGLAGRLLTQHGRYGLNRMDVAPVLAASLVNDGSGSGRCSRQTIPSIRSLSEQLGMKSPGLEANAIGAFVDGDVEQVALIAHAELDVA